MTLQPQPILPVPSTTATVARAAFPKGNVYLQLRDELGTIYEDSLFARLYPNDGQPAATPWRLALVTILQFAENLPDRQAADAVRSRIDWKYLLGLELTDPGFDYSVLSEFRSRLITGEATNLLLDHLLHVVKQKGILKERGRQRTDSTHILAAVRDLSRLELVGTTLLHALNSLTLVVPEWLKHIVPPDWPQRYDHGWEDYRLPKSEPERVAPCEQIGQDGFFLLSAVYAPEAPSWLRHVPTVDTLRRVWVQNFSKDESGVSWRRAGNIPPAAEAICSPFDVDARYCIKRQTEWIGYKVHLTETCDADAPHLLVHVMTTAATKQDSEVADEIHQALREKDVLPRDHLLDQGYCDSHVFMKAHDVYGIEMVMPMRADTSWQAQRADAFSIEHFHIDWEAKQITCPQGKTSAMWVAGQDKQGHPRYDVQFNTSDCAPCPARHLCTHSKRQRRKLTIRQNHEFMLLQAARAYQHTDEFKTRYAVRAGVEGTISEAVVAHEMRTSRYRGMQKTHLQHIATATASNIKRLVNWWNEVPCSHTKRPRFSLLMAA
jgi:transposase